MGTLRDVLEILVTDGRRPSNGVLLEQVQGYWERAFKAVPTERLTNAVEKWLLENKRGWPRVAELMEIIKAQEPAKAAPELLGERQEALKRHEIQWAISILENPERFHVEQYRHTIETAEHYLRRYGYQTWREAKAWLVPGWVPSTTTEVWL